MKMTKMEKKSYVTRFDPRRNEQRDWYENRDDFKTKKQNKLYFKKINSKQMLKFTLFFFNVHVRAKSIFLNI